MQITSVKFSKPKNKEGEVSAIEKYVSICLDDCLIIRGLRIIKTKAGERFVAFPSRKLTNGDRLYSSFPTNEEFRVYVQETVLSYYDKEQEAC